MRFVGKLYRHYAIEGKTEMLTKDTRVKQFRLGAWNEGGAGVTVAEL